MLLKAGRRRSRRSASSAPVMDRAAVDATVGAVDAPRPAPGMDRVAIDASRPVPVMELPEGDEPVEPVGTVETIELSDNSVAGTNFNESPPSSSSRGAARRLAGSDRMKARTDSIPPR